MRCTGRVVSGTVRFTASAASDRVTISRGRVVYAAGLSVQLGGGQVELLLSPLRAVHEGRYTLTTRTQRGRHIRTRRATITIR